MNTAHKQMTSTGATHREGGWPTRGSAEDPERQAAARKRALRLPGVERDLVHGARVAIACAQRNNIIDAVGEYFPEEEEPAAAAGAAAGRSSACGALGFAVDDAAHSRCAHCRAALAHRP